MAWVIICELLLSCIVISLNAKLVMIHKRNTIKLSDQQCIQNSGFILQTCILAKCNKCISIDGVCTDAWTNNNNTLSPNHKKRIPIDGVFDDTWTNDNNNIFPTYNNYILIGTSVLTAARNKSIATAATAKGVITTAAYYVIGTKKRQFIIFLFDFQSFTSQEILMIKGCSLIKGLKRMPS